MFKQTLLSVSILSALAATPVLAAEEGASTEVIKVSGIRGSLISSMSVKQDGNGVVDAISAEDIGKFPDTNLAESLQRITGVSIDRSSGEGQQVTVRGMGPSFNLVTLNGRQMPNSGEGRAFDFSDIASEMVSGVEVYKTSSAAMQSGGIGALINITTARPLALGDKISASAKMSSDVKAGEITPQISGLISREITDNFGILFAGAYQQRKTEEDRLAVTRWNTNPNISGVENVQGLTSDNYFVPQQSMYSRRQDERTRINGNLVLQYKPSDNLSTTLDIMYADEEVDRYKQEAATWFSQNTAQSITFDNNGTTIAYDQGSSAVDFFAGKEVSRTLNKSAALGAEWKLTDSSTIEVEYSTAKSESNPDGEFNINQSDVQFDTPWGFEVSDELAYFTFDTQDMAANGSAGLRTWVNEMYQDNREDQIDQTRFDYSFDDGGNTKVKAGLMYTDQTKDIRNAQNDQTWDDFAWDVYGSQDVRDEDYNWNPVGGFMDAFGGAGGFADVNLGWFNFDPIVVRNHWLEDIDDNLPLDYFYPEYQTSSYTINEKTTSAYLELTSFTELAGEPLTIVVGARYEDTKIASTGNEQTLLELEFTDPEEDMNRIQSDFIKYTDESDYNILLPSLSVKYEATDELIMRFAASRSITRPSLNDMTSVRSIRGTRPGLLDASAGNPGLRPFVSDNLDLSAEWYFSDVDYVSVGAFVKNVSNFIVTRVFEEDINGVTDPSTGTDPTGPDAQDKVAIFNVSRPANGEDAQVYGYEIAGQYAFGDTGFGTVANVTLVFTDSDFDRENVGQTFAVTGLSHSANLVGYYEKDGFQARLAYNWRDEFLQRFGQNTLSTTEPTIVDAYSQLDLTVSYDLNDELSVFLEGINITDEAYRSHGRYANQLVEATDVGARYSVGIRGSF
ncbi:TonB-dependent receptor [Catenovulum sediminis]|uniref:TonB-dependent receptor n=1 Tax=Catenovulum sediminis TaxID=1740262 RepID=UPI00117DFC77|nr:TonB-dependent receptor [Catenovulum sediminis]